MANLNSFQKINRVLPGNPYGLGVDGSTTISSDINTRQSCSGSASSTTLTLASLAFANGDLVLIHQTRGTGAGQWEINRITSGGGTTSLTLQSALNYTYTDSGNSQAQVIKIPQYTTATITATTLTAWTENVEGIFVVAANTAINVTGALSGAGKGFNKGLKENSPSYNGEGTTGASTRAGDAANGNGGGGSNDRTPNGGGSGGGNGTAGTAGGGNSNAGATAGAADLTTMVFGGGGGGGETTNNGDGGNGGAIIVLIGKTITITGSISVNGDVGSNANADGGGGGGGAGGSVLIMAQTATLGTNLITASGGSGGTGSGGGSNGGSGGTGRIALHYSSSYTGSTSPSVNATQDSSLQETSGSFLFNLI